MVAHASPLLLLLLLLAGAATEPQSAGGGHERRTSAPLLLTLPPKLSLPLQPQPTIGLHQLRGGAVGGPSSAAELTRAKLLLLLSNAGFGSYSVLLRALSEVQGAEPLGTVFITFVRYSFLFIFATVTRYLRSVQAKRRPAKEHAPAPAPGASLAAFELAVYSVVCALLSVWGTCRVTSAMSEIYASTDHVFVPLMSVVLGIGDFGARTWGACAMAFGAAVLTALIDAMRGDVGSGGAGGSSFSGAAALVASAWAYAIYRVRTTVHLHTYAAERLNLARMRWMGGISALMLLVDVAAGGPSAQTLRRISHIKSAQWMLMAAGVFISGFLSASLQFEAMRSISAAKAQPFAALQPLFAGIFGYVGLHEPISVGTAVGGMLMISAALLACADEEAVEAAEADAEASAEALDDPERAEAHAISSLPPLDAPLELIEGEMLDEMVHPPPEATKPKRRVSPLGAVAAVAAIGALVEARKRCV